MDERKARKQLVGPMLARTERQTMGGRTQLLSKILSLSVQSKTRDKPFIRMSATLTLCIEATPSISNQNSVPCTHVAQSDSESEDDEDDSAAPFLPLPLPLLLDLALAF